MVQIGYFARNCVAAVVGKTLRRTSFRFSSDYRHGVSRLHRFVYALCNTVAANYVADGCDCRIAVFWGYPRQSRYWSDAR